MNQALLSVTLLASIMLVPGATFGAEVYKWTDSQGQIHYSNLPPPSGVEADVIPVFEAPEQPAAPEAAEEEVDRIRAFTQELETARREREQRREEQRLAQQKEYYERLLAEQEGRQAEQRREREDRYYYPYPYYSYPAYPPYFHPPHPHPWQSWHNFRRHPQWGLQSPLNPHDTRPRPPAPPPVQPVTPQPPKAVNRTFNPSGQSLPQRIFR